MCCNLAKIQKSIYYKQLICFAGLDIMYLLKNIKHNVPLYYEKMEEEIEDEETLHEVVDFLLDIRNRLAHECYLHNSGSHSTVSCFITIIIIIVIVYYYDYYCCCFC